MQARYYDPVIGRFYSNDPIGFTGKADTFNRYSYVANNPFRYTDPTGMSKVDERENRNYIKCEKDPNCTNVIKKETAFPRQTNRGQSSSSSVPPLLKMALNDNGVKSALNQAWEESNPNAPLVPYGQLGSRKLEQGGWIVSNLGKFRVIRVGHGTRDSLPTIAGTKPQGMVLGWFHTHPNTSAEGYSPTSPSLDDVSFTRNARVTGLVIHHKGIIVIPYK